VLGLATPVVGQGTGRDIAANCEDASMNTPRDGAGDVKLTADVVEGATVAPGDDIRFRLTWDPSQWSGDELDRALTCVRVKGALEPDLSAEEAPTANDGVVEYRLHVPDNIRPDCDVCAEGFVTGGAADGGPRQVRSERLCFMSGPPRPPTPPATTPVSAPPAIRAEPTTTTTARVPAELPTEVRGITAGPLPDPGTAVGPAAELPRTGTAGRAGAAGGGLALALGGLAVMGGAGRSKRRGSLV
jgi:hypothetical protein